MAMAAECLHTDHGTGHSATWMRRNCRRSQWNSPVSGMHVRLVKPESLPRVYEHCRDATTAHRKEGRESGLHANDNGAVSDEGEVELSVSSGDDSEDEDEEGMPACKYRLLLTYDGTAYHGWQMQTERLSVQHMVETALTAACRQPREVLRVVGSGRTDAGVHARGQVVHFCLPAPVADIGHLHASLNGLLPPDIRVLEVSRVKPSFHARNSARAKVYHYAIFNRPMLDPFQRLYAWHVYSELDVEKMRKAAAYFVGSHDFTSFANSSNNRAVRSPLRTIYRFHLAQDGPNLRFEVEGSGFLYKQVRNMVGLLVHIGKGLLPFYAVPDLLAVRNRSVVAQLAPAAPSSGLSLISVHYPHDHRYVHDDANIVPCDDDVVSRGKFVNVRKCLLYRNIIEAGKKPR